MPRGYACSILSACLGSKEQHMQVIEVQFLDAMQALSTEILKSDAVDLYILQPAKTI